MKKSSFSFLAFVLLVLAGLSVGARDPGGAPFPFSIQDKIWKSVDGKIDLIFKKSTDKDRQMDIFISSECQSTYFGSTERIRQLDNETFLMGIRDRQDRVWYAIFKIEGKRQMMHLILSNGTDDIEFGTSTTTVAAAETCL